MKLFAALLLVTAVPVAASSTGDELRQLPASVLVGRSYAGVGEPAEITFINTRREAVRVLWIDVAGRGREYRVLAPGDEYLQPTYTTHRWLIESAAGGAPLGAFIATRANVHGDGVPQIALIR
jgi:hypothetical protein